MYGSGRQYWWHSLDDEKYAWSTIATRVAIPSTRGERVWEHTIQRLKGCSIITFQQACGLCDVNITSGRVNTLRDFIKLVKLFFVGNLYSWQAINVRAWIGDLLPGRGRDVTSIGMKWYNFIGMDDLLDLQRPVQINNCKFLTIPPPQIILQCTHFKLQFL